MKSSPSTATVLILLMLLMIVAAGFVFLFQAELRFRDHLRMLTAENETLQASQANLELEISGAVATRDALAADLASAEGDTRLLEGQLVESQQTVDDLTATVATRTAEMDQLTANLATLEGEQQAQPPVVRIVSPAEDASLPVSQPVEIVLVASDPAGLSSLTLDVNGRRFTTYTLDGERLYAQTLDWNAPATEGDVVFTVSAVNINNVRSAPHSVTVTLADIETRNADIRAVVEANVSELRGLTLLEPIEPVILSREELRTRVESDLAADVAPEESRADVLELSAFDFLGRDYDLRAAMEALQGEGILGFYDPETAEFVVVNDGALLDPAAQWTHAHEFVHALQDQHYDLDALNDESRDSEARAAVRALAEGEAELVQYLYLFEGGYFTDAEAETILSDAEQTDSSFLREFPPVLVNDLSFPYTAGVDFVLDLYRAGGFAAIDAAWANPPVSTEQIIHPDR
ncbi:MAG TPA: Ig-like domain-containing protein, partial [Promineifilum sp.]|nr:Ig-like domain-containing protein [Promineifilum sp.]